MPVSQHLVLNFAKAVLSAKLDEMYNYKVLELTHFLSVENKMKIVVVSVLIG